MGANHADVKTLSLCLVWSPKFHLLEPTRSWKVIPSIPVKLSHMDISVEI